MTPMSEQRSPIGIPEWTLGDRLRKTLDAAGLTQQEMADELGYSRKSVGDYISGRTTPRRPVLVAWAMRTGVPVEWLETGEVPNPGPDGGAGQVFDRSGWFRGIAGNGSCAA